MTLINSFKNCVGIILLLLTLSLHCTGQDSAKISLIELQQIRVTQLSLKRCNELYKVEKGKAFIVQDQYQLEKIKFKKADQAAKDAYQLNFNLNQKLKATKKRNRIFIASGIIAGFVGGFLLAK